MFSLLMKLPSFLWGKAPVMQASQVFEQVDPGCLKILRHMPKKADALILLGERIRKNPHIMGMRLEHEVDPESGRELIFLQVKSNLSLDDAMDLESEIINSIAKKQWSKLFKDTCITVEARDDD